MARYSTNRPNRTVTLHREDCSHIPTEDLRSCGCGPTGEGGNHEWYCETHVSLDSISRFMRGRQWAILFCDRCYS